MERRSDVTGIEKLLRRERHTPRPGAGKAVLGFLE
jgi:hypothetical protein